ncbi:hypothetical protein PIB30_035401 [Stylosanthes scabra]|uniref:Uncharacterized protein n=1 Tax=Stylosanthes scabra TaxID=79078 RepID=A0ABU6QDK4_9FABA|nr:hypothetical protein [Stylosanthes scabra]
MAALDEPKSTTFDSGEPYSGLVLSNRQVREVNRRMSSWPDRLAALVIPQVGNLRFSPPSSYTTQDSFSLLSLLRDEAYRTVLPMSGCFSQLVDVLWFYWWCAPGALTLTSYALTTNGFGTGSGPYTYDPATELVGDPDEPYVAEHVPYGAPEAYYSDDSYGSERESSSTDTTPSSHHSSGSSSGSVSLGYGSASSESASDGASDDDLVNQYFAGTFPPP